MYKILAIISILTIYVPSFAQDSGPKEMTPETLAKIKTAVEKEVIQFKKTIANQDLTPEEIEFSMDTFRISHIASKQMEIDYSNIGMRTAVNEMTDSYDKLMNTYYKRLLNLLNTDDRKVLIKAQKSWLTFRDAELDLIFTLTQEMYSGGGTIQLDNAAAAHSDLVGKRMTDIFNYYMNIIKNKPQ